MTRSTTRPSLRLKLAATTALVGAIAGVTPAVSQVTPLGTVNSTVASGALPTVTPTANGATVDLNSQSSILNWDTFSIGAGQSAAFNNATGANAAVLNRVLNGVTTIAGAGASLTAGSDVAVYISNPNGVVIGTGANINVGSLIAGTLGLTDADFTAGDQTASLNFTGLDTNGVQITDGTIQATGAADFGHIVLLGGKVESAGALTAGGDVAFIAGRDITVTTTPGSPLGFTIASGTTVSNPITVSGTVSGKNISLAFVDAGIATNAVLSVDGTLTATTASLTDKGIELSNNVVLADNANATLSSTGKVTINGTVDSSAATKEGALTIDAAGPVSLAASLGDSVALKSLVTTGAGAVTFSGATVEALGAIDLSNPVVLGTDVTFASVNGGSVTFRSTIIGTSDGAEALTVNTAGTTKIQAAHITQLRAGTQ